MPTEMQLVLAYLLSIFKDTDLPKKHLSKQHSKAAEGLRSHCLTYMVRILLILLLRLISVGWSK